MLLSYLIGYELRLVLIWSVVFPGICLVTFNDACTFQARTTKRTLEIALVVFAVPFLVLLMLGLRKNYEDGWKVEWWPTLPIRDWSETEKRAAMECTTNATLQMERTQSMQGHMSMQNVLWQALALLQTNIILLLKSVYNYVRNPKTAMILQLKVKRTDVGADEYLHSLTPEEKRRVREWRTEQRELDKAAQAARDEAKRKYAKATIGSSVVATSMRTVEKHVDTGVDMVMSKALT